jgi:hypothetical protein
MKLEVTVPEGYGLRNWPVNQAKQRRQAIRITTGNQKCLQSSRRNQDTRLLDPDLEVRFVRPYGQCDGPIKGNTLHLRSIHRYRQAILVGGQFQLIILLATMARVRGS